MDTKIVIENAEIFNGKDPETVKGNILIENNLIGKISAQPLPPETTAGATVIDGAGKFLMPGLIDAHWHAYLCCNTMADLLAGEPSYTYLVAGREATATLLRGFTTIRDAGGPVFGLKRAIDNGVLEGPRIYPSGAMISQTSGHGDFSPVYEQAHGDCCCGLAHVEELGASRVVDGPVAVTAAVRENLKKGASQIKLMAGGGAASLYDPLDVTEFFDEELQAAVRAAEDWGTYVMVHVYNPRGIARALKAGVKSIEHGHLIDEATNAKLRQYLTSDGTWKYYYQNNIGGNFKRAAQTDANRRFFTTPFGQVAENAVVSRADNYAAYCSDYPSAVTPLLVSTAAGQEKTLSVGVNQTSRIVYLGDANLNQNGSLSTQANATGTVTTDFDRLTANLWAWIVEQVCQNG